MIRPQVKPEHTHYRVRGERILICRGTFPLGNRIADPGGRIWTLLRAADGTRTSEEIAAAVSAAHPGVSAADVRTALGVLADAGHLEDAGAPLPDGLTPRLLGRYDRAARYLQWADSSPRPSPWTTQAALLRARVAVIGVGDTASVAAHALAASGVGRLRLLDPRPVGPRVLRAGRLRPGGGRAEGARLAARIRRLNSDARVSFARADVSSPDDFAPLARGCDAMLLLDDDAPGLQRLVNRACLGLGTPWAIAGVGDGTVFAGMYDPGSGTACWECPRPPGAEDGSPGPRHDERPDRKVLSGLAGYLGAQHAMSLCIGVPAPRPGSVDVVDLADPGGSWSAGGPPSDCCPACGPARAAAPARVRPSAGTPACLPRCVPAARVLILGAGGTGGVAAMTLAAAGVRDLTVVDDDTVAESNLTRQVQYTERDIGRAKAEQTAARVMDLHPAARAAPVRRRVTSAADVEDLLAGHDVLVLAADEPPELRRWVNEACLRAGTAWVDGGYHGPVAHAGVYDPLDGSACRECHHSRWREAEALERTHPEDAPPAALARYRAVGAVSAGVSGLLAAQGALWLLAGRPSRLAGTISVLNLLAPQASYLERQPRREDCPACSPAASDAPPSLRAPRSSP